MRRRRVKCVNNSVSTHYTQYSHMSRKVTEHIPIHNIMQQSVYNTLNDLTHPVAVQEKTTSSMWRDNSAHYKFITIIVSAITIQRHNRRSGMVLFKEEYERTVHCLHWQITEKCVSPVSVTVPSCLPPPTSLLIYIWCMNGHINYQLLCSPFKHDNRINCTGNDPDSLCTTPTHSIYVHLCSYKRGSEAE